MCKSLMTSKKNHCKAEPTFGLVFLGSRMNQIQDGYLQCNFKANPPKKNTQAQLQRWQRLSTRITPARQALFSHNGTCPNSTKPSETREVPQDIIQKNKCLQWTKHANLHLLLPQSSHNLQMKSSVNGIHKSQPLEACIRATISRLALLPTFPMFGCLTTKWCIGIPRFHLIQ